MPQYFPNQTGGSICLKIEKYEQPPRIRYQYPGQEAVEVIADDYSVEPETGKCQTDYQAIGTFSGTVNNPNDQSMQCGNSYNWFTSPGDKIPGEIIDYRFANKNGTAQILTVTSIDVDGNVSETNHQCRIIAYDRFLDQDVNVPAIYRDGCFDIDIRYPRGENFVLSNFVRLDGEADDCGDCVFKIIKDGEVVQELISPECPNVKKLACELGIPEYLQIDTNPLGYVEVTESGYSGIDGNGSPYEMPAECLEIYNVSVYLPIGSTTGQTQPIRNRLGQFCSIAGCPPPRISPNGENCPECKTCPPNTCAIQCEEVICCHDLDGYVVETIPLDNYCEEAN